MVMIYNDSTAKDRQWKGLDKLKAAMEQETLTEELDEIIAEQNTNN
jgi:hypothetical protein